MSVGRRVSGLVVAFVFTAGVLSGTSRAQDTTTSRILVVPFENLDHDASIFWLSEAAAVLLTDDLTAIGGSAITRDERRQAFARLQVPANAALTDATFIRIGELVGASEVVVGSFRVEGGALVVHARSIRLESGRIGHDVIERGPMPELFATFERTARRLLPDASTPGAVRQQPALAAFENYIKGLMAETPSIAAGYLSAAVAAQPTFDRARLGLWDVYTDQGEHAQALAAVEQVPVDSVLSRRARFAAALSLLSLKRYDEAFAAFKVLADAQPTAAALNNVGVAILRRGATQETGSAVYCFDRAVKADQGDGDYCFNLGYAYLLAHDEAAATYWLREAVRRNPVDGDAHLMLGASLAAGGSTAEAAREEELARRLSSSYEARDHRRTGDDVPRGLERVKDSAELPNEHQIDAVLAAGEQRDQRDLARFYLDRGRRLFQQGSDREALIELDRVVYLSPYEAEAHLLIGQVHLRNARLHEAIDALKISLWSSETPEAHLALGEAYLRERDLAAARTEAERALALDSVSIDARRLLERTSPH